jgi:hypothetical protein
VSEKKFSFGTGTNNTLVPLTHIEGSTSVPVTAPLRIGVIAASAEKIA